MIDVEQAQNYLRAFPWPNGVKKPSAYFEVATDNGRLSFACHLYRLDWNGDPIHIMGPTPEGSLRHALIFWLRAHDLSEEVIKNECGAALRQLIN